MSIESINFFAALGTIALQAATLILFLTLIAERRYADLKDISAVLQRWGLHIAFLLATGASAVTLLYSEVLGFEPCGLCWLQRVFLYPLVVLFAVALYKKGDRSIADYVLVLSGAGLLVALYQHYLQMGGTDVLPCPAVATAADCAQRFLFEFGYITFPLMAATLFASFIGIMLCVRRK
jgi:disulfide bond formation protein DsbB